MKLNSLHNQLASEKDIKTTLEKELGNLRTTLDEKMVNFHHLNTQILFFSIINRKILKKTKKYCKRLKMK